VITSMHQEIIMTADADAIKYFSLTNNYVKHYR
jgi:hypothetical protein